MSENKGREMAGRSRGAASPAPAGSGPKGPQDVARERALWAWERVDELMKRTERQRKEYGVLACKLPSYLQTSGLGQTLAFLYAHQGEPKVHGILLEHLQGYLGRLFPSKRGQHVRLILELTPQEYRRATKEMEAAAQWLKRFAQGRLDPEQE